MKIMTVCGFGVGTSLLLKMTVDSILEEEGINGEVEAIDMTSACGNSADLILTSKEIGEEIEGQVSGKLVYISNFMDKEEVKEKILKAIRKIKLD
ncbi:PTS sugar transporter subunit IIB [Clostridium perfringens]|uniref:PTS sugar transporter subunit IIB n=1 Tax=Clostridium perfringens TaxID=1502 RepID=UPI0010CF1FEA|nr:PTS sugar transporter subunit IIB [Clostridium perfringens]VTQ56028.1 PTS system lactose/cellobiose-specific transporter subunit IIB [Clostridium perfringens]